MRAFKKARVRAMAKHAGNLIYSAAKAKTGGPEAALVRERFGFAIRPSRPLFTLGKADTGKVSG